MTVVAPSPEWWSVRAMRNGSRRLRRRTSWVRVTTATHGRASTPLANGRPEPIAAEPDRVVGRQAGLGRDLGDDPARLVVVG